MKYTYWQRIKDDGSRNWFTNGAIYKVDEEGFAIADDGQARKPSIEYGAYWRRSSKKTHDAYWVNRPRELKKRMAKPEGLADSINEYLRRSSSAMADDIAKQNKLLRGHAIGMSMTPEQKQELYRSLYSTGGSIVVPEYEWTEDYLMGDTNKEIGEVNVEEVTLINGVAADKRSDEDLFKFIEDLDKRIERVKESGAGEKYKTATMKRLMDTRKKLSDILDSRVED